MAWQADSRSILTVFEFAVSFSPLTAILPARTQARGLGDAREDVGRTAPEVPR
jgi:hypothetical protein